MISRFSLIMLPSLFTPRNQFSNHIDFSGLFQNCHGNWKKKHYTVRLAEFTAAQSEGIESVILVICLVHSSKFLVVCGGVIYPPWHVFLDSSRAMVACRLLFLSWRNSKLYFVKFLCLYRPRRQKYNATGNQTATMLNLL